MAFAAAVNTLDGSHEKTSPTAAVNEIGDGQKNRHGAVPAQLGQNVAVAMKGNDGDEKTGEHPSLRMCQKRSHSLTRCTAADIVIIRPLPRAPVSPLRNQ
jgi:hypothetical protein